MTHDVKHLFNKQHIIIYFLVIGVGLAQYCTSFVTLGAAAAQR